MFQSNIIGVYRLQIGLFGYFQFLRIGRQYQLVDHLQFSFLISVYLLPSLSLSFFCVFFFIAQAITFWSCIDRRGPRDPMHKPFP